MAPKLIILATVLCFVAVLADKTPEEIAQEKRTTEFKTQCETNGGNFKDAIEAPGTFKSCIKFDNRKKELEDAKEDETAVRKVLLERICQDWKKVTNCMEGYALGTQTCYATDWKKVKESNFAIVNEMQIFVCKNEELVKLGSFFSDKGVACLEKQTEALKTCWATTVGKDPNVIDVVNNVHLTFNKAQCDDLSALQKCVVDAVKNCSTHTAAIDSVFKHLITEATPCKTFVVPPKPSKPEEEKPTEENNKTDKPEEKSTTEPPTTTEANKPTPKPKPDSASGLAVTSATIILAAMAALFY